jgi:hypothetical protein
MNLNDTVATLKTRVFQAIARPGEENDYSVMNGQLAAADNRTLRDLGYSHRSSAQFRALHSATPLKLQYHIC